MKKRLFALLLVVALMLCIAPVASFAEGAIKKADGTAATNGTDYRTYYTGGQDYWEPITNDLTVSIIASSFKLKIGSVNKITLSNSTFGQIEFTDNNTEFTLNLDGSNKVNNALTINASNKTVTLSGTGTLYLTGDSSAAEIASGCTLNYSAFDVLGSTESNASIDSLTSNVELSDNNFKIDGTICKTVYFTHKTAKTIADILPNDFPTTKQTGWANDTGSTLFVSGNNLKFGGVTLNNAVSKPVIKIENNYVYYSNPFKITFVMNSNQLVKIITAGSEYANYNGEFIAQHIHGTGTDAIAFATPWDGGAGHNSMPTEAGSYYLTSDITLSSTWSVPTGTTNLCLNGFVIKQTQSGSSVINIPIDATLNLHDCGTATHKFSVGDNGLWTLDETNGTKTVIGGVITGGTGDDGAGVCVGHVNPGFATFNMYGGNIVGNKAAKVGGGVYVMYGNFNMTAGNIIGNTANNFGGGLYLTDASTTSISGTVIISENSAVTGGGITFTRGTLTMSGGEISNNKATNYAGGIYITPEGATFGGSTKIFGNTLNGETNNLFISSKAIAIGTKTTDNIGNGVAAPTDEFTIGVNMYKPGQFTSNGVSTDTKYFTSDNDIYKVEYNTNGYLELKATTIADVLATNTDFPTSNSWNTVPESAWESENGATAHLATNALHLLYQGNGMSTDVTAIVTSENDNYVYTYGSTTITFNMTDDVLESITVSGMSEKLDGTYRPVTYYTVTFDTDGGSAIDAQEVEVGGVVTQPTNPTKEGYTFFRWLDKDGKPFVLSTPITEDITLKASWLVNTYSVKFYRCVGDETPFCFYNVSYNNTIGNVPNTTRKGYIFKGWYYNGKPFDFNTKVTCDMDVYAEWEAIAHDYKITEGAHALWLPRYEKGFLSFRSNADYSKFVSVEVDNKILDASKFIASPGSTIVKLKPEYLSTLAIGKHTLRIVSTDGYAETDFYIEDETIAPTDGGFLSEATMSTAFVGMGIVGLSAVFYVGKKKKLRK